MRILRVLFPMLVLSIMVLVPQQAFAASATFFGPIVPAECECKDSAPDFGCVLQTIENGMNFAISIGVIIFVLVAAYAGLLWMFSPINAHNREQGRTILTNAIVGLLITLGAWLLVDFVMKTLYNPSASATGGSAIGPWNSILGTGDACLAVRTPTGGPSDGGVSAGYQVGDKVECRLTESTSDKTYYQGTVTEVQSDGKVIKVKYSNNQEGEVLSAWCRSPGGTGPDPDNRFTFQTGVDAQNGARSQALVSLMSCIAGKVPGNVGQISAITDKYSTTDTTKIKYCAAVGHQGDSQCAHTKGSCHYGGGTGSGQSYAVDFGDEWNREAIIKAANECGAQRAAFENGNHVHVSAKGASCD